MSFSFLLVLKSKILSFLFLPTLPQSLCLYVIIINEMLANKSTSFGKQTNNHILCLFVIHKSLAEAYETEI